MKKNLLVVLAAVAVLQSMAATKQREAVKKTPANLIGKEVREDLEGTFLQVDKTMKVLPAKANSETTAKPGISYKVPQGTLFYGLSNDYYGLTNVYGVASPYVKWTFQNVSTDSPALTWTVNEYNSTSTTYVPTTKPLDYTGNNLSFNVTTEGFQVPIMKGSLNGSDSTFIFGKNYASVANTASYIDAGGSSYNNGTRVFNLSNWFRDLSQTTWNFAADDYCFGTGTKGNDAVVAYYEKPQSTLYFEGANFFLGAFSAPAGATFTLRIITVDTISGFPVMKDTLATSYIKTEDVLTASATALTMPFTTLVATDADGLETEIPYVEVDDAFVLELSWTNTADTKLAVRASSYDARLAAGLPYYANHAYFYGPDTNNNNERALFKYSWSATLNTSLTNAAYAYLVGDANSLSMNVAGDSKTFTLVPYYGRVWLADSTSVPSWISHSQTEHYTSENWGTDITLTAAALPIGTTSRSADITFKTWGAKKVVHIEQTLGTGLQSVSDNGIRVMAQDNTFKLTYTSDYTAVSIFNLAGQQLGNYTLPATGETSIPAQYAKGIYILKLVGTKSATVKVLK